uniref:Uncharacterized protein n=1 Tax=Arundo donax TaxID=35708 RepID=A0A0A9EK22_ARUDO
MLVKKCEAIGHLKFILLRVASHVCGYLISHLRFN